MWGWQDYMPVRHRWYFPTRVIFMMVLLFWCNKYAPSVGALSTINCFLATNIIFYFCSALIEMLIDPLSRIRLGLEVIESRHFGLSFFLPLHFAWSCLMLPQVRERANETTSGRFVFSILLLSNVILCLVSSLVYLCLWCIRAVSAKVIVWVHTINLMEALTVQQFCFTRTYPSLHAMVGHLGRQCILSLLYWL